MTRETIATERQTYSSWSMWRPTKTPGGSSLIWLPYKTLRTHTDTLTEIKTQIIHRSYSLWDISAAA